MQIILIKFLIGLVGFAYIVYGKKQQALSVSLCGLGMILLSYFAPNPMIGLGGAVVLALLPYFLRG